MTCGVYLVDAVGFFFQFFPCAVMCFVPFDDDKLKIRKRTLFFLLTLCVLAVSALFPLAVHLATTLNVIIHIADAYMLLTVILSVVAYGVLVRENYMKKLLVIYIVIFYAALIFWLTNLVGTILDPLFPRFPDGTLTVYLPKHLAFYLLSFVTVLPVFVIFLRRYVSSFLREIEPERMRREFRYATVSTVAFLILMMTAHMLFNVYEYNFLLNSLLLFLVLNQAIMYWMIVISAVNRSREENALRALQAQKLQYDRISTDMERAARLRPTCATIGIISIPWPRRATRTSCGSIWPPLPSRRDTWKTRSFARTPPSTPFCAITPNGPRTTAWNIPWRPAVPR